jgi:hypothetical protein
MPDSRLGSAPARRPSPCSRRVIGPMVKLRHRDASRPFIERPLRCTLSPGSPHSVHAAYSCRRPRHIFELIAGLHPLLCGQTDDSAIAHMLHRWLLRAHSKTRRHAKKDGYNIVKTSSEQRCRTQVAMIALRAGHACARLIAATEGLCVLAAPPANAHDQPVKLIVPDAAGITDRLPM